MVKKILAALDGTADSEAVLRHIRMLLKTLDVDVRIVNVAANVKQAKAGKGYLRTAAVRWKEHFPYLDAELLMGNPAEAIIEQAVTQKFDLIAVATHARGTIGKFLFGSVTEDLLHTSPVPVFVARLDVKPARFRSILVPLDGSARAKEILPLAGELGRAAGGRLVLMMAVGDGQAKIASTHLLKAQREMEARGVEATVFAMPGRPVDQILAVAAREKADLIAISTHGRTGSDRANFGSVTEAVLRRCPIPMLVNRTMGLMERGRLRAKTAGLVTVLPHQSQAIGGRW